MVSRFLCFVLYIVLDETLQFNSIINRLLCHLILSSFDNVINAPTSLEKKVSQTSRHAVELRVKSCFPSTHLMKPKIFYETTKCQDSFFLYEDMSLMNNKQEVYPLLVF